MFPLSKSRLPTPVRIILISLLVIGIYVLQDNFGWWPYQFFKDDIERGWPRLLAYGALSYGVWMMLVPILVAMLVGGPHLWASAIGLDGSIWDAAKVGLISTAVLPVTYAFIAPLSAGDILFDIFQWAVFAGIGEEIFFRGLIFGLLFRFARWGFVPAALLGATIFGIGHLYQGNSLLDFFGIFGITAIAAVWWSWMYIEWDNNVWVPAALHILMNSYFQIFDVADGTLGGWSFFFIRALVVLISIGLTVRHAKRRGHFKITRRDLLWRRGHTERTTES